MAWSHVVLSSVPQQALSIEEAKKHLDVTFEDDDDLIQSYLDAAVSWVQEHTGHYLSETNILLISDRLPAPFNLPFSPFIAVDSVTRDASPIAFRTAAPGVPILLPPLRTAWPQFAPYAGAIAVNYRVGYATGTTPPMFAQAIRLILSIYYDKPDGADAINQWKAVTNMLGAKRNWSL